MSGDDDLEADIRAAMGEEPAEPAAAPQPDAAAPSRDDHGRFAPKLDKAADLAEPAPEEPARTILAPRTWTAAAKAKFATLDPDVQREVVRREKEIDDGKAQWDSKAEQYNRYEALFAPVKDRLTLSGIDQFAYTQALIRADEMLRTNPQAAMQQLAQLYGFTPQGFAPQPQPQPSDPALQTLQQQVHQLTQHVSSQQQAREEAERQAVAGEIESFRTDPKHQFFDNVKPAMVKLLESGLAKSLDDAYEMACQVDPEVRKVLTAKPVVPAKPGKPRDISVTGSPAQARPSGRTARETIEDDVRAAIEELGGRV